MELTGNAQSEPTGSVSLPASDGTDQGSRGPSGLAQSPPDTYSDDAFGYDLPDMDDWRAW